MIACGDSTGPTDLDPTSALHSLVLGMQHVGYGDGITRTVLIDQSLDGMAPFLSTVTVTIGGSLQPMYAMAVHESLPPGTCTETLFGRSPDSPPDACTPPLFNLAIVLWQSRSAGALPDRMILLNADVGTSTYPPTGNTPALYGVGVIGNQILGLTSATLTSSVTATPTPCGIPLPTYAKSGNCSIAAFDVEGSITYEFEHLDLPPNSSNRIESQTLTIPRQTIHGWWMAISEVQPCSC
jgi:hypothetical protein